MFYSTARSIDNQATATTFRAAYVRYASETEVWFDGTPQSIDGRIARANRLMHLAKESVSRQGMDAEKLASIGELQADVQALTALRHDLLTAGADREDTSPIAGVHIAMPAPRGTDPHFTPRQEGGPHGDIYKGDGDWFSDYGMEPDDEDRARWKELTKQRDRRLQEYIDRTGLDPYVPESQAREEKAERDRRKKGNCGDDEEYAGGEDDEDGEQFKEGRAVELPDASDEDLVRELLRSRAPHGQVGDGDREWDDDVLAEFGGRGHKEGGYFGDGQDNDWRDEGYGDDYDDKRGKRSKHRMDEVGGSGRPVTNPYTGDDGGSFSGNPKGRGHWDKAGGLSPDDRRFVVLESAKFLADNTDTGDVRELATRAQHFAQQVTSTYSAGRSQAVTTAFVRRVASAAAQRRTAVRREPSGESRQIIAALPPETMFL